MRLKHLLLALVLSVGCSALGAQAPAPRPGAPAATPTAQTPRPAAAPAQPAIELSPPRDKSAVLFAIIGDSGTGSRSQYESRVMAGPDRSFPGRFVIMSATNLRSERPQT